MAIIFFHYIHAKIRLKNSKKIKEAVSEIFKRNKVVVNRVDYIFCSDEYLLRINKKFLSHDHYTDVITFYLNEKNDPVVGEIYISTERIKVNAFKYRVSQDNEVLRIIFHGALHLCGFSDKTKAEKKDMTENEDYFIGQFKVSRNTVSH